VHQKINLDQMVGQIDNHINLISKNNSAHGDLVHWFQQSPLHWLLILYIMKFYIRNTELSKQEALDLINDNVILEGKKTTTTEFKYINDAVSKGYIISSISQKDARKKILLPSEVTIKEMFKWFNEFDKNSKE